MNKFLTFAFFVLISSCIFASSIIDRISYTEPYHSVDARVVVLAGHQYVIVTTSTRSTKGGVGVSILHAPSCLCNVSNFTAPNDPSTAFGVPANLPFVIPTSSTNSLPNVITNSTMNICTTSCKK